jgi:very-short-patch-repair endonuclease
VDLIWKIYGIPTPETEVRFHATRRWRFDYAWRDQHIAVEIEGAIWTGGRHTRGSGFVRDMEKYNEAGRLGWRVFRFSPQELKSGKAQTFIKEILKESK